MDNYSNKLNDTFIFRFKYHQSISKLFTRIASNQWFGATDTKLEGTWRWWTDNAVMSIGASIVNSTISWGAGHPAGGTSYNCLYWDGTYNRVYAGYCTWSYYSYCEHPGMNFHYRHMPSPWIYSLIVHYIWMPICKSGTSELDKVPIMPHLARLCVPCVYSIHRQINRKTKV